MSCPNNATCPSARLLPDGTWLIVGTTQTHHTTRLLGGNPDDTETGVIVPAHIIEEITAHQNAHAHAETPHGR